MDGALSPGPPPPQILCWGHSYKASLGRGQASLPRVKGHISHQWLQDLDFSSGHSGSPRKPSFMAAQLTLGSIFKPLVAPRAGAQTWCLKGTVM